MMLRINVKGVVTTNTANSRDVSKLDME